MIQIHLRSKPSIGEPFPDRLIPDKGDGSFCHIIVDLLACFLDGQNRTALFFVQGDSSFVKLLLRSPDTPCFLTKEPSPACAPRRFSLSDQPAFRPPPHPPRSCSGDLLSRGRLHSGHSFTLTVPRVRAASAALIKLARVPAATSSTAALRRRSPFPSVGEGCLAGILSR